MLKRAFDILVATVMLVVLSPILLIASLAVLLETGRPVLFRQIRLGEGQERFQILKLRTMHHQGRERIDQYSETIIQGGGDSRVTRVGRILRATSIDELPQLWNIIVGDMSIVGPRPVLPEQLAAMPEPAFARFAVRPGLTGLAQVRGRRTLSWLDQLEADVEYANSHSLAGDIIILMKTVWVVLTAKGLYPGEVKNWREYIKSDSDWDGR